MSPTSGAALIIDHLGGEQFLASFGGLDDIDPDSKEAYDIGSALAGLDKLCAK